MIIKASRILTSSGARAVASHVLRGPKNESIELLSGSEAQLDYAMQDARSYGSKYGLRHYKINPGETATPDDMRLITRDLAQEFGFDADHATLIWHKKPRAGGLGFDQHAHLLVAEYDPVKRRVLDWHHSFARHEKIARVAEARLGHVHTAGRHNRAVAYALADEGHTELADKIEVLAQKKRPNSSYRTTLHQRAQRLGHDLPNDQLAIALAWAQSDNAQSFRSAIAERGITVREGDKKGVWIAERAGDMLGAVHRLAKANLKDVSARLNQPAPSPPAPQPEPPPGAIYVQLKAEATASPEAKKPNQTDFTDNGERRSESATSSSYEEAQLNNSENTREHVRNTVNAERLVDTKEAGDEPDFRDSRHINTNTRSAKTYRITESTHIQNLATEARIEQILSEMSSKMTQIKELSKTINPAEVAEQRIKDDQFKIDKILMTRPVRNLDELDVDKAKLNARGPLNDRLRSLKKDVQFKEKQAEYKNPANNTDLHKILIELVASFFGYATKEQIIYRNLALEATKAKEKYDEKRPKKDDYLFAEEKAEQTVNILRRKMNVWSERPDVLDALEKQRLNVTVSKSTDENVLKAISDGKPALARNIIRELEAPTPPENTLTENDSLIKPRI